MRLRSRLSVLLQAFVLSVAQLYHLFAAAFLPSYELGESSMRSTAAAQVIPDFLDVLLSGSLVETSSQTQHLPCSALLGSLAVLVLPSA